ncbi:LamG-like jellyroll fold domain-containing protein [Chitinophaga rhizosphaerae]|uniref:LamG-like jellyroll fold domain-containing protein n=1 Tax=Chitinophaga rhizosphaerae TaxID=1864947 RepID=UPI000F806FEA|nr:LamG-like jellyroll fold domain-containing protein [Chitinophaga rhizosphaerae]
MKKKLLFMSILCAAMNGEAWAQSAPSQKDYGILHVNGKKAPPDFARSASARTAPWAGNNYYLLQFYDIPTAAEKAQLSAHGIELQGYLPNFAFYAWFGKDVKPSSIQTLKIRAVLTVDGQFKLSPELFGNKVPASAWENGYIKLDVTPYERTDVPALRERLIRSGAQVEALPQGSRLLRVKVPLLLLQALVAEKEIQFISVSAGEPVPEFDQNNFGRSNVINSGNGGVLYNGKGITTMVKEGDAVNDNIDFAGRLDIRNLGPEGPGSHATGCANRLGHAGNTDPSLRSNAWGARIISTGGLDYYSAYADSATKLRIVNMSYGWGTDAGYNGESVNHDRTIRQLPEFMLVYSSGNSGGNVTNGGKYNGIAGWGNLTGNPKHAKNLLVVSGTNYEDVFYDWTCKGPAFDGRVKPELSIEGSEGTSFAAPKVAGMMAILYDAFKGETGAASLKSAMIKAIMMNTADDIHNPGIDFKTGYGRPNMRRAYEVIKQRLFITDSMQQGGQKNFAIQVPSGTKQLRVMLYWSDYEATAGTAKALVNDLDMTLAAPGGGVSLPWVLDTTANPVNLNLPPTRNADHLNNTEQITIDDPSAGEYTVNISGYQVPQGVQEYYITYEFVRDEVNMAFPIGGESLIPGNEIYVRWDALGSATPFDLHYSADNGSSWSPIATGIAGGSRAYKWKMPAAAGKYLVRVTRGALVDTSSTFSIFPVPANFKIDWVCDTAMQLRWNSTPGTSGYEVFRLGQQYMEPVLQTADTVITLHADSSREEWFAVRAIGANGEQGLRSLAIMKRQGTFRCDHLQTSAALRVRKDSVVLAGTVNPHRLAVSDLVFEYGPTTAYGQQVSVPGTFTGADDIPVNQLAAVALTSGESWHFRMRATVNGQTVYSGDAQFLPSPGLAAGFNGEQSITMGPNNAIDGAKPRTVAMWAKADVFDEGGLFMTGSTGTTYGEFSFKTLTADNTWRAQFWNNNRDFTLPDSKGEWHHYALTYNGTQLAFYYDGALQATWNAALVTATNTFQLGVWNGKRLKGSLDEVSVWNTALSADQVRKMMHHPLNGNEAGLVYYANFDNPESESYELVQRKTFAVNIPKSAARYPFGEGVTATATELAGTVNFPNTGVKAEYAQQNGAAASMSNIVLANYDTRGLPDDFVPYTSGFKIGHRYGTGNLSFVPVLQADRAMTVADTVPGHILLMGRNQLSSGKWNFIGTTTSATLSGELRFSPASAYEQFLPIHTNSSFVSVDFDTLRLYDVRPGAKTTAAAMTVSGVNLGDTVRVLAPEGFEVSLFADSAYTTALGLVPQNGFLSKAIVYARFKPQSAGIFNGTIRFMKGDSAGAVVWVRQEGVAVETAAGKAMNFDGTGDNLNIENLNWQPTEFTIEWWAKYRSTKNYNQSIGNGWGSFLVHADGDKNFNIGVANNAASRMKITGGLADLNVWHHYAYTFKNGEAKLYRDGVLEDSKPASSYPPKWASFRIGSGDGNTIDGEMDEFRMWSVARTQADIRENMHLTLTGAEAGLKVYLQFQDNMNGVADLSANAYPVRMAGNPVRSKSGVPAAQGVSETKAINAPGNHAFTQTGVELQFGNGTLPGGDVVISRLKAVPDTSVRPATVGGYYYVLNNFGTDKNYTGLSAVVIDSVPSSDYYKAYGRKFNDFGSTWALKTTNVVAQNGRLVITPDSATPWNAAGQFAVSVQRALQADSLAGKAFRFNGSNAFLEVEDLNWKPTEFTVEWWIKANSARNYNQYVGNGWGRFLAHANDDSSMYVGISASSASRIYVAGAFKNPGQWHHYAYTFNNGASRIYRDGILMGTNSASAMPQTWGTFRIGSPDGNTIDGDLDEFRIWSVARTDQQVRESMHHTLTGQEPGLKVYIQGHGADNGNLTDLGPNHYNVTLIGGVSTVNSTAPVAKGESQTQPAAAVTDFGSLGITLGLDSAAGVITASRLHAIPDSVQGTVRASSYWILHQYETPQQLQTLRTIMIPGADSTRRFAGQFRAFNGSGSWSNPFAAVQQNGGIIFHNVNGTGSRQWMVTEAPNSAPQAAITSPVPYAYLDSGAISVTMTAQDADGFIGKVALYAGGVKIGETDSLPYQLTWSPAAIGSYTLTAVATDNNGLTGTSQPVTVTIRKKGMATDVHNGLNAARNGIIVYPNPTAGVVYTTLPKLTATAVLRVITPTGSVIWQENVAANPAPSFKRIDITGRPSGIYYVQVIIGTKVYTITVVKI